MTYWALISDSNTKISLSVFYENMKRFTRSTHYAGKKYDLDYFTKEPGARIDRKDVYPDYKETKTALIDHTIIITPRLLSRHLNGLFMANQLRKIRYSWPYKYNKFIIFEEGVDKDDLELEVGYIKHKETGDEIYFDECFNVLLNDGTQIYPDARYVQITPNSPKQSSNFTPLDMSLLHHSFHNLLKSNQAKEQFLESQKLYFLGVSLKRPIFTKERAETIIQNKTISSRRRMIMYLNRFDANFDSNITVDEIRLYYKELRTAQGKVRDYEFQRERDIEILTRKDVNQDGIISYQELTAVTPEMKKSLDKSWFKTHPIMRLDTDGDGQVSLKDYLAHAAYYFDNIDTDKDEIASPREVGIFNTAIRNKINTP